MKRCFSASCVLLGGVLLFSCGRGRELVEQIEVTDGSDHVNLDVIAQAVVDNQDKGATMDEIPVRDNQVEMPDGSVYQLIDLSKTECPAEDQDCKETDSAQLGIGDSGLVDELDVLRANVRNQGSRSTCVAFAIDAGMESLIHQDGGDADLSEQYTYLVGHRIEAEAEGDPEDWEEGGLWPDVVLNGLVEESLPIVMESDWPYNMDYMDCTDYLEENPGFTCSESEVQGGGTDNHEPDARTESADGYVVLEAEELYASLGHIKQALYAGYPVVVSLKVNSDWNIATYKAGTISWIFKSASCGNYGCGHAVLAVGYKDDERVHGGGFVVLKNSWDKSWGAGGLGYATYEWLDNSLRDAIAVKAIDAP